MVKRYQAGIEYLGRVIAHWHIKDTVNDQVQNLCCWPRQTRLSGAMPAISSPVTRAKLRTHAFLPHSLLPEVCVVSAALYFSRTLR